MGLRQAKESGTNADFVNVVLDSSGTVPIQSIYSALFLN